MSIIDKIEFSVCEDCLITVANGFNDNTSVAEDEHVKKRMKFEMEGRKGHWVTGVEPTENDEEGRGYNEFSRDTCELCLDFRAGSRHGVTLLIEGED